MHISDRVRRHQLLSDKQGLVSPSELPADLPLSLKEVCERVFGGSISVASLKAEHRRGNLEITKIGRAYFTTPADLKAMLANCRVTPPKRVSIGSNRTQQSEASVLAAQAALRLTIEKLKAAGRLKTKKFQGKSR